MDPMVLGEQKEKLKYPKTIWFITIYELCERFSYYGLRTVLMLYLTTILQFNEDYSTIIFHSFMFLAYLTPLFGAILADSNWGKFNTVILLSVVYALGNAILTSSSMVDMFGIDIQKIIAILGLFFISIGTGGIKSSVFPFGADQFRLPQQEKELINFTAIFLVVVKISSFVSTFVAPEIRHDVHCFGKDSCFPLAFGLPAGLMFFAIVIFVAGKKCYLMKKPEQNAITRTFGCILYALRTKLTTPSMVSANTHWLDYAKGSYTEIEISETKAALKVIAVFVAFPVFWALHEQHGSRWTLQAMLMDGRIDYLDWTIKPDQMMTLFPFFGFLFLVTFDIFINPLLKLVGIREPWKKFTLSGILAAMAYICAAQLQFNIFGNTTVIQPGEARLNIYSSFDCDVILNSSWSGEVSIEPLAMVSFNYTPATREDTVEVSLQFDQECSNIPENFKLNTTITFVRGQLVTYYLTHLNPNTISLIRIGNYDNLVKDKFGNPNVRILIDNTIEYDKNITLNNVIKGSLHYYTLSSFLKMEFNPVKTGTYKLLNNGKSMFTFIDFLPATFYTLTIQRNDDDGMNVKLYTMNEGNYIHILWQLPQYLFMIIADVIFTVTSIEFSWTKAPTKLKTFISTINLFTASVGNLLIVFISSMSIKNQAHEYLLYSGLMCADTVLLAYLSIVYQKKGIQEINTSTLNTGEEITVNK